MKNEFERYVEALRSALLDAQATDLGGKALPLQEAVQRVIAAARSTHQAGHTLVFVGNGGSAAIAGHMAIDYTKNGGLRSLAFNDGASLTCLGNDLGFENVFAKQIEMHGQRGDLLLAISSSGNSANILNAVREARKREMQVVTFSGFGKDNKLRPLGDVNFYVPSKEYGFVEISHLTLCHTVLDQAMGWQGGELQAKDVVPQRSGAR